MFEATLAKNGVDVIADLEARSACNLGDVLDLSLALGRKVTKRNIGEYVRVAGDQLLVRTGGAGAWETWATLTGVKEGDKINIRTCGFDGWIKAGASEGDSKAPVFDPTANYNFEYDENQMIGAVVGTVDGASDAGGGVTQYRFTTAPSGASLVVQATNSVSSDGYFEIDNTGKIILTELGWAATVNDYDDKQETFEYFIEAGDAAGNWSVPQKITLSLLDIASGTGKDVFLILDRQGLWFDNNEDGKLDVSDTKALLEQAGGGLWRAAGVGMEKDNVSITVIDGKLETPLTLDLAGFGGDGKDKIVVDGATNYLDFYNCRIRCSISLLIRRLSGSSHRLRLF